jgi:type III pantothenate kinase
MTHTSSLLAIEVGSSRVKLGWFPSAATCTSDKPEGGLPIAAPALPEPAEVFRIEHHRERDGWIDEVEQRLDELHLPPETVCVVAVVHQAAANVLLERVLRRKPWARVKTLTRDAIAIKTNVKEPARIGIDRLCNALAANRLRSPQRAAIVVDMGTAMTVNLISQDGVFQGGAILVGPLTALGALHAATSSLPLLGRDVLETSPDPVGKSTSDAMASGAYWGAIGAVNQLIEQMASQTPSLPEVFLTGGAAGAFAGRIVCGERVARYLPNLVLSGIRLAADESSQT